MSYVEVQHLLAVGFVSETGHRRLPRDLCKTWRTDTTWIRFLLLHGEVPIVTWVDRLTDQCRFFIDAEVVEIDGKVMITRGFEVGPPEWN